MKHIIIGLGFGDEGKGMFTDYLSSRHPKALVVRYTGGHQVGHTVVTDSNTHVFSNFGSGTLRNIPTYWSKYCTVEPIGLIKEYDILIEKGIIPKLFIDSQCPITTPYDIEANKESERINKHGSCGVGYGATLAREENYYSLTFEDLFYPIILRAKLEAIKEYYGFHKQNPSTIFNLTPFFKAINRITTSEYIKKGNNLELLLPPLYPAHIYEGAQGLLLDKHFGFFPNVTRSNLGTKNIIELENKSYSRFYLITRAYQTRHGNGFMTNQDIPYNILVNPNETNISNTYQGDFRRSLLDVNLLEYAIGKDKNITKDETSLVITCLDHIVNDYRFTYKGMIILCKNEEYFVRKICEILKIESVYLSRSPNSQNIEHKQLIKEK